MFQELFSDKGGVVAAVKYADKTGQTASLSAATLVTPATAGAYRVSLYACTLSAGSAGTLAADVLVTDDVGAKTISAFTAMDLTSATAVKQASVVVYCAAAANIRYQTTLASGAGAPTYNLHVTVERLS